MFIDDFLELRKNSTIRETGPGARGREWWRRIIQELASVIFIRMKETKRVWREGCHVDWMSFGKNGVF